MAVTVKYTITLNNKTKDHAKDTSFSATIVRTSPATLDTSGMSVTSATIDMGSTTFWSGSGNNPYINIGNYGRIYVDTDVDDKSSISITEPSSSYDLNEFLCVGTDGVSTSFYATKSTSGNVCTYTQNYVSFVITVTCKEGYGKSSATVTASVAVGSASTVTISNSKISDLSHKVTWSLGTTSYSKTVSAGTSSASYTIPSGWLSLIPEATSATAGIKVETFNPSGTSLGSNSYSFTVTVPDTVVPIISLASERIDNAVPSSWEIYVQGKSGIKITATASPGTGSSISNYTVSGGTSGSQTSNVFTISPVSKSGTVTYTVRVTDKRGRSASASVTISVCEYSAPTMSVSTAFRCDEEGTADENGTYANVKLSGSVAFVDGKNTKALSVSYAESGSSAFSSSVALSDNVSAIIGDGVLDTGHSYQVRFRVTDAFGYTEKIVNVSTAAYTVFFKEGGNAVAFGKVAEHDNALEINEDWAVYHGDTRLDGTVAIGRGGTGAETASAACENLGAVKKTGDTMTGNLTIQGTLYPSLVLKPTDSSTTKKTVFEGSYTGASSFAAYDDDNNRRMLEVRSAGKESSLDNAAMVRSCVNGTWGNYRVFHSGMATGVPVANGGTGATTAADARSNLGTNNASNLSSGTVAAARLPFKFAYGSTSCNGSSAASISYSSAGFTAVPVVLASYSTTSSNWSGDNGALKVYSKTKTGANIIVGGSFSTSRNIDWFAFGV